MADTRSTPSADGQDAVARQLRAARERHLRRLAVYMAAGYDRAAAVRFVVDRLGVLASPVLDVGSGQGMVAIELARQRLCVVRFDVNTTEQLTAIANSQAERVQDRITFVVTDARLIPAFDGKFGATVAMDVLHHLPEGQTVFAEMVRVVKPSGRIVIAELDQEGLALVAQVHQSEGREHPIGPVTFESAVDWFLAAGLVLDSRAHRHYHSIVVFTKP